MTAAPVAAGMVLPAQLTLANANRVLAELARALPPGSGPVAVDASGLVEQDSAVLAVLLALRRLPALQGRALSVHGAPPRLVELAQLYGVDEMLGMG